MEDSTVRQKLADFALDPLVRKLQLYYSSPSLMRIMQVERREIYHSRFLKWLFEDEELKHQSIKFLLHLLLKRKQESSYFPHDVECALLTNSFTVNSVSVELEKSVKDANGNSGRTDLAFEINYNDNKTLYLVIENKVDSDEHKTGNTDLDQTQFYYDNFEPLHKERVFVFIDLSGSFKLNNQNAPSCKCKKFIHINYQDIVTEVLERLLADESLESGRSNIIKDYLKTLSIVEKNLTVMAIPQDLREMLLEFWDRHKDLFTLSLQALEITTDDADVKHAAEEVRKQAATMNRNLTKYSINNGTEAYAKRKLIPQLVELYGNWWLKKSNNNTTGLLVELQTFTKNWRTNTSTVETQVNKDEELWTGITIEGQKFYVYNNCWNYDNVKKVLKDIEDNYKDFYLTHQVTEI